jgi:hypothetical protein
MVTRSINKEARTLPLTVIRSDTESVEFVSLNSIEENARSSTNLPPSCIITSSPEAETGASHPTVDKETLELHQQSVLLTSRLFNDKLFARFRIHQTGLKVVEDPKLHKELSDFLVESTLNSTFPSAMKAVERIETPRSETLQKSIDSFAKNIEAFKSKKEKKDDPLKGLHRVLKAFAKSLSDAWPDDSALSEKKASMLQEMVAKARDDHDGPRLFLTLVLTLLAKNSEGMVYATGKFAPRLLKQIQNLDDAQLARLRKMKDDAKSGTLGDDDKNEMRKMIEEAAVQAR